MNIKGSQLYIPSALARTILFSMLAHALFLLVCWRAPLPEKIEPFLDLPAPHMLALSEPEATEPPPEHVVITMAQSPSPTSLLPASDGDEEVEKASEQALEEAAPEPPEVREREPEEPREPVAKAPDEEPTKPEPRPKPDTSPEPPAKTAPEVERPEETAAVVATDDPSARAVNRVASATRDSSGGATDTSTSPRGGAANKAAPSSGRVASSAPSPGKKSPDLSRMRGTYMRALVPRISKSYYYPAMAKRLGQEGRVLVALRVDARGELVDVKVHRSSGHAILDKAAVDALRRLGRLPAPPRELLGSGTLKIIVPMHYNLGVSS